MGLASASCSGAALHVGNGQAVFGEDRVGKHFVEDHLRPGF